MVKLNRIPMLRDVLHGCYDGVNEPTGEVSLSGPDYTAFVELCKRTKIKHERTQNLGYGAAMVSVSELLAVIKATPPDAVAEAESPGDPT